MNEDMIEKYLMKTIAVTVIIASAIFFYSVTYSASVPREAETKFCLAGKEHAFIESTSHPGIAYCMKCMTCARIDFKTKGEE
jgi:hypothetical protein